MDLTRRDVLRTSAAVGGAAALGVGAPAAEAAAARTTLDTTIARAKAGRGGYARLLERAGDARVVRTDLGIAAAKGRGKRRTGVLAFAHLSDVHVVDHQSPARVEWADRFEDRDQAGDPVPGLLGSAHRPQEILSAQVADAMVRAVNAVRVGPVTGRPIAFALQTGDNSDNSQYNETRWNIDVLDGGRVRPDSGSLTRYEGVMDTEPASYDVHYWHPDGTPAGGNTDLPRATYGFPVVEGLLDTARRPFTAAGLDVPWYTAFGNHDQLWQGTFPSTISLRVLGTGPLKLVSPPAGVTQADLLAALRASDPSVLIRRITASPTRLVTPDADRRGLTRAEWIAEHFETSGTPVGHGFTEANRTQGHGYYTFDKRSIRFVVLDTVNPHGYSDGSIDPTQLTWLTELLEGSAGRIVVLASHHTIDTMTNPLVGTGVLDGGSPEPRILGDQVRDLLLEHPCVVAWVNGHTHVNQVFAHQRSDGRGGFWEVNTASHIDFPMQSRLIEIADNHDGTLSVFATVLDHAGPVTSAAYASRTGDPVALAGLSRELGANDWQERATDRGGAADARNVELLVADPRR